MVQVRYIVFIFLSLTNLNVSFYLFILQSLFIYNCFFLLGLVHSIHILTLIMEVIFLNLNCNLTSQKKKIQKET